MSKLAELEQQIEAERTAAAQADWEAGQARARKAAEEQRRQAEGPLGKAVGDLERKAKRALERAQQTAAGAPLPGLDARLHARRLLIGTLTPPPGLFAEPQAVVTREDPAAAMIWDVLDQAQRAVREAERQLGPGHTVTARADTIECELWRAFQARIRQIAGEAG
jgi:hypothetical protein